MSVMESFVHPSLSVEARAGEGARRPHVLLTVTWGLLVLSCLPWRGIQSPIQIPQRVEEIATAVAVAVACVLALCVGPRVRLLVIPVFLLASLLAVAALVPWINGVAGEGSLERAVRLASYVAAVWILAPAASREGGEPLVRAYLGVFAFLASLIALEALLRPALGFEPTLVRLQGVVPPVTPPRVGEIGAVTAGLATMAGVFGVIRRRSAIALGALGGTVLVLSHTRTAMLALSIGLVIGFAVAVARSLQARRALVAMTILVVAGWLLFWGPLSTWLARGQSEEELASLTGRRDVWELVLERRPSGMELWFGAGLADKSFEGLPIDSGWLAVYVEQGLVGIALVGWMVLAVGWAAWRRPASAARAIAAFLLTFVLVSSVTETGVGDASTYLLHVFVAAVVVAGDAWRPNRAVR